MAELSIANKVYKNLNCTGHYKRLHMSRQNRLCRSRCAENDKVSQCLKSQVSFI